MGLNPSFPIPVPKTNISFESEKIYTSSGKLKKNFNILYDKTGFESATEKHFSTFVDSRVHTKHAKEKSDHLEEIRQRFPQYSLAQIKDFRFQFMTYDVNQDGLIDYSELSKALDHHGDTSTEDERRRAFDLMDTDKSDGIDFEEFVELMTRVASQDTTPLSTVIRTMCRMGKDKASVIRRLSIEKQLELELF